MPPIETNEKNGIKIMIMEDSKIGIMDRSKHASENSPSAVSDLQDYELRCSKSSLLPLDVNNTDVQNNLTMTKKIIVQKGNEKDTIQFQFPVTTTICAEKRGKPSTNRNTRNHNNTKNEPEKIEIKGKFSYDNSTKQWAFTGAWSCILQDGFSTSALPFCYKSAPITNMRVNDIGKLRNEIAIGDWKMPEKLSWSGSFSNSMKKQNTDSLYEVKETFELLVKSETKQLDAGISLHKQDIRHSLEGTGKNKFGNFTLRGHLIGTSFNGVKEYHRMRPESEISLNLRKRNKDVKRPARVASPAPVPKVSQCPKAALKSHSSSGKPEPVRKSSEKPFKPVVLRVHAGKKRPRELLQTDFVKSAPSKKARAKKRVQDFVRSITNFALEKSETRSRTYKEPLEPGAGSEKDQVRKMCLRQNEKTRKLIKEWNSVKGQFAPSQGCTLEGHYIYKGFNGEIKTDDFGICAYMNGFIYEGEFLGGRMHGRGVVLDPRRAIVYQGEFSDDRIHGVGTFYFPNGDRYDGEWKEGTMWGWGIYKEAAGHCYKGEWVRNKRHGYGTITFKDGSSYTGEWADDQMHGRGTLALTKILSYDGNFKRGKLDGRGLCSYDEGGKYEGNFKSGMKDGRGTYTFSNGAIHEGRFRNDKIDGTGFLKMNCDKPVVLNRDELMIPINCQSEMRFIHLKAGFSEDGT